MGSVPMYRGEIWQLSINEPMLVAFAARRRE